METSRPIPDVLDRFYVLALISKEKIVKASQADEGPTHFSQLLPTDRLKSGHRPPQRLPRSLWRDANPYEGWADVSV